jgi:hypothetical protein
MLGARRRTAVGKRRGLNTMVSPVRIRVSPLDKYVQDSEKSELAGTVPGQLVRGKVKMRVGQ